MRGVEHDLVGLLVMEREERRREDLEPANEVGEEGLEAVKAAKGGGEVNGRVEGRGAKPAQTHSSMTLYLRQTGAVSLSSQDN